MQRPTNNEAQMVVQMTASKGWEVLCNAIESDIEQIRNNLVYSNSMSLAELTRLQGEIIGLENVLKWVKERHNQIIKHS